MFRLDNILERWAELYTPLSHKMASGASGANGTSASSIKNTFFRISLIDGNSPFIRNFASQPSPCMAYATHVDAEISKQTIKSIIYHHAIYFLAKQQNADGKTDVTDDNAATEARFLTDIMVQDLLAFLFALKAIANGKTISDEIADSLPDDFLAFMQTTAADPQYREGLRGLQLEDAHWGTLPTYLNGWQICGLTIDQVTPRHICLNSARY